VLLGRTLYRAFKYAKCAQQNSCVFGTILSLKCFDSGGHLAVKINISNPKGSSVDFLGTLPDWRDRLEKRPVKQNESRSGNGDVVLLTDDDSLFETGVSCVVFCCMCDASSPFRIHLNISRRGSGSNDHHTVGTSAVTNESTCFYRVQHQFHLPGNYVLAASVDNEVSRAYAYHNLRVDLPDRGELFLPPVQLLTPLQ